MYITNDRNFSLLGARGFGKPGDYNSRILLLVNGHRVNDNVFGQAEIGAEFGLDPAMFERVEIIRGPASSLYGDSAFFAVVNVITRTGASLGGGVGDARSRHARHPAGARHRSGTASPTVSTSRCPGPTSTATASIASTIPAFDTPDTNNGVAEGLDGERRRPVLRPTRLQRPDGDGRLRRRRQRTCPTASFGTLFNEQDIARADDRPAHAARRRVRRARSASTRVDRPRLVRSVHLRRHLSRSRRGLRARADSVGQNSVDRRPLDRRRAGDAAAAAAGRW